MIQDQTTFFLILQRIHVAKSLTFMSMGLFVVSVLLLSKPVLAQGVSAGTDISNTVVINYNIGGIVQQPIEGSPSGNSNPGVGNGVATVFKVDRKIDLVVTGDNNANVTPGDLQSELSFTLLNEGNDIQEFSLSATNVLATDIFDGNNCNYDVTSVSGTPLPGVSLPVSTPNNIKLKADQQASITVKCDIPFLSSGGQTLDTGDDALIALVAKAEKNDDGSNVAETTGSDTASNIDTVFADVPGTDDSNRDANHSARRTYVVTTTATPPTLSIDKSIVSISDSSGGNTAVPGSEVTYEIQVDSAGAGFINNLVVSDPTPANMTYKAGTIKLNNTTLSDADDSDNADFGITSASTATVNLGSITAGSQFTIELTYIIN